MKNVFTLTIIVLFLSGAALLSAEQNLIQNPSFEESVNGHPSIWNEAAWNNEPGATTFGVDAVKAHSGKSSAVIVNDKENHARFVQAVTVSENSSYRFSAWIRTENVGEGTLGSGIGVTDKLEFGGDIRKTSDWKQAELYIKTGPGINSVSLMLTLGTYGALNTGKAWFDDVSLVKVDSIPSSAVVCLVQSNSEVNNDQPVKVETAQTHQNDSAVNNDQTAKVETAQTPANDSSKIKNGLFLFIIIGIIIVIGGGCYLVIFITLKKKKPVTVAASTSEPETNAEEKKE